MKNYGAKVLKKRTFGFSRSMKTEVGSWKKKNKNKLRTSET